MTYEAAEMKHFGHEIETLEEERAKLKKILGQLRNFWPDTEAIHNTDVKAGRNLFEGARLMIRNSEDDERRGDERRAWMHLVIAQSNVIRGQQKQLKDAQTAQLMERPNVGGRRSNIDNAILLYRAAEVETGGKAERARKAISKNSQLEEWYGNVGDPALCKAMRQAEKKLKRN